jgi:hypothetical protein
VAAAERHIEGAGAQHVSRSAPKSPAYTLRDECQAFAGISRVRPASGGSASTRSTPAASKSMNR